MVKDLPQSFLTMLFYNKVITKPNAEVLLEHDGDTILAVWDYGKGRAVAFAPDIAPHGATDAFLEWEYFGAALVPAVELGCRAAPLDAAVTRLLWRSR